MSELQAENARLKQLLKRCADLLQIGVDIAHGPEFHGNAKHVERCPECRLKREGFNAIMEVRDSV